jgi:L-malate glycosyltransferase
MPFVNPVGASNQTTRTYSSSARNARNSQPVVIHWVFGNLRKRGSFEDYLVATARASEKAAFRLHVVTRALVDPAVRAALETHGAIVQGAPDQALDSPVFFARTLLQLRPSLVHCHFGSPSTHLALIAKALGVRHFVFTDHGSRAFLDKGGERFSLRRLRRKGLSHFIDLYLPVSNFVGEQIRREVGVSEVKVVKLFNGVDLNRFHPSFDANERERRRVQLLGLAPRQRCVFYVGQLNEAKGICEILAIQDEILRHYEDVSFVWIGDGPMAPEVARRASPRVRYLGLRNDIEGLLPAADLILAPSRWHEAFCLTVAEAAAAGVPAMATRVGGLPEVVSHGETGLVIEPGDCRALLRACDQLLGDADLRRRMGAEARRRAETHFSLSQMVDSTLLHYRALGLMTADTEATLSPVEV